MAIRTLAQHRLRSRALIGLALAVVALAYALLGTSLVREPMHQGDLSSRIDDAQAALASTNGLDGGGPDALTAELDQALAELDAAETAFPEDLDGNDALLSILTAADGNGVRLLSVAGGGRPDDDEDDTTTATPGLTFDVEATGNLDALLTFLQDLGTGAGLRDITVVSISSGDGAYHLGAQLMVHTRPSAGEGDEQPESGDGG